MSGKYIAASQLEKDVLVPVPIHRKRLRYLSYNEAELLARKLGKLINLPMATNVLVRLRHTPQQARTASLEERKRNIANCFDCRGIGFKGQRVLPLDDVATSETTLDAHAAVIKANRANIEWGLIMVREI